MTHGLSNKRGMKGLKGGKGGLHMAGKSRKIASLHTSYGGGIAAKKMSKGR